MSSRLYEIYPLAFGHIIIDTCVTVYSKLVSPKYLLEYWFKNENSISITKQTEEQ